MLIKSIPSPCVLQTPGRNPSSPVGLMAGQRRVTPFALQGAITWHSKQIAQEVAFGALALLSVSALMVISAAEAVKGIASYVNTYISSPSYSTGVKSDIDGMTAFFQANQSALRGRSGILQEGQCSLKQISDVDDLSLQEENGVEAHNFSYTEGFESHEATKKASVRETFLSLIPHELRGDFEHVLNGVLQRLTPITHEAAIAVLYTYLKNKKAGMQEHSYASFIDTFTRGIEVLLKELPEQMGVLIENLISMELATQSRVIELLEISFNRKGDMQSCANILKHLVSLSKELWQEILEWMVSLWASWTNQQVDLAFQIVNKAEINGRLELINALKMLFNDIDDLSARELILKSVYTLINKQPLDIVLNYIKSLTLLPKAQRALFAEPMLVLFTRIECEEQPREIMHGLAAMELGERASVIECLIEGFKRSDGMGFIDYTPLPSNIRELDEFSWSQDESQLSNLLPVLQILD